MPLVLADRVQETSNSTGTGTITLAGAVSGFNSFSVIGNGNTTYYTIVGGTQWEVGLGTYTSSGTTLSRDTVLSSSNSNALVDFSAGVKTVFVTYPAGKSLYYDASGNVGIGTSSPIAPLTVSSTSAVEAGSPCVVLQGGNNTERIAIRAVESAPGAGNGTAVFLAGAARGTVASPTATQSGDALGYYQLGGYTGTAWGRGAWIQGIADGAWSGSNQGSHIVFSTTPNASTTIAERMRINSSGMVLPGANNTYDLGSTSLRWRNIYTNDLHLSNGIGDYTVVEGEEDLFLYNNKTGKVFKFLLTEVKPEDAPPKARGD